MGESDNDKYTRNTYFNMFLLIFREWGRERDRNSIIIIFFNPGKENFRKTNKQK